MKGVLRDRLVLFPLVLLLCMPLLVVLTGPFHAPAPEWSHVSHDLLPAYAGETIALLAITLAGALVAGVSAAWLVASFEFPLRGVLRWALVLPLACPTYIAAFVYAGLLGPTGSWSVWLHERTGFRPDIMHLPGLGLVLATVLHPYVYLSARAAFTTGMSAHLDVARTLGSGGCTRFRRVALPLARPAIAAGGVLVAMEALNDYGAVKYFGIRTLTTGIFRAWGGLYDMGSALRLGALLLLLVAVVLWVERIARGRSREEVDQAPVVRRRLTGAPALLASAWCVFLVLIGTVIPWTSLVVDAVGTFDAIDAGALLAATARTLLVATLASAVTLVIALLFAFAQRHKVMPPVLLRLVNLGYVIPGAVIATGVMVAAGVIDRSNALPVALIGGIGLLVYAFTVRFLAVAGQPLQGALRQQPTAMDDAARILGATPARTFLRVNLPLMRPALLAAAMLVAMDVVKELPLTMILRPFDFETLSTSAFELARIEQLREASLPALAIVLCGTVPVLLLDRWAAMRER